MAELVAVCAVSLAAGTLVGWWGEGLFRDGSRVNAPPLQEAGVPAVTAEEAAAAASAVQRERERLRRRLYAEWMETLGEMGMRVVPEATFEHLALFPLDASGRVNEEARKLFLLSDEETERLNDVVAEAEARLLQTEMDHLEILYFSDDEAVFVIPAFGEGLRIEESMRDGIVEVLGEVDGELFWRLMNPEGASGTAAPERWKGFGRVEREIVFAVRDENPFPEIEPEADVVFWLQYEERVAREDSFRYFQEEGRRLRDVNRITPVRFGESHEVEPAANLHGLSLGRYEYLVSYLPEELRVYFDP